MSPTVIHSTRLFDGYTTHDNATVVLDQNTGTITSVSTDSTQNHFPSGATVIDGSGHTLLPGLIEAHCHVYNLHLPPGADESDILQSPLRCGITTVCDMHSDLGSVNNWRKKIAEELEKAKSGGGTVALSDLKTSLLGATIEGGWPKPIVLAHDPSEEVSNDFGI